MTEDELLARFGLPLATADVAPVREILRHEMSRRRRQPDCDGADVIKLCCVQLFGHGDVADSLTIWKCKRIDFDLGCSIDIQLLCGAGVSQTLDYLRQSEDPGAEQALEYLGRCMEAGDFLDFSPSEYLRDYVEYYAG